MSDTAPRQAHVPSFARRRLARFAVAALLLMLGGWAQAACTISTTGNHTPNNSTLTVGAPATLEMQISGPGCTGVSYTVVDGPSTNSGIQVSSGGTGSFGGVSFGNVAFTTGSPPNGGGSASFNIICNSGCDSPDLFQFTFTLNLADFFELVKIDGEFQSVPTGLPYFVPFEVESRINGVAGPTAITWDPGPGLSLQGNPSGDPFLTSTGVNGRSVINGTPTSGVDTLSHQLIATIDADPMASVSFINVGEDASPDLQIAAAPMGPVLFDAGVPIPVTVRATVAGVPTSGANIDWSLRTIDSECTSLINPADYSFDVPSSVTDGSGEATVNLTLNNNLNGPLGYCVRGTWTGSGDVSDPQAEALIDVLDNIEVTAPADTQTPPTVPVSLDFDLQVNGAPIADGQNVVISVEGTPPGDYLFVGGSPNFSIPIFTSGGQASVDFSGDVEGIYVVRATYTPPQGPPVFDEVLVDVAVVRTITALSPLAPISGQPGEEIVLTVDTADDGSPPASETIDWVISGVDEGQLIGGTTSLTDANGEATKTFRFGPTAGAITVTASRSSDPSVSTVFALEQYHFSLTATAPLATPAGPINGDIGFQVRLDRVGVNTAPVGSPPGAILWSVLSSPGGASFAFNEPGTGTTPATSSTAEPMGGLAGIDFVTDTGGAYQVQASFSPPPSPPPVLSSAAPPITTNINANIESQYTLGLSSSAQPFVNRVAVGSVVNLIASLQKQPATALSGETVLWTVLSGPNAGTLSAPSAVTDTSGDAAVTFTPTAAGPYVVEARVNSAAAKANGPTPIFETVTITGLTRSLVNHASPPTPIANASTVDGVKVQLTEFDGANTAGVNGEPVNFTISSGDASFEGGGTTALNVLTNTDVVAGIAASPRLVLGMGASNIVIDVSSGALNTQFVLSVSDSNDAPLFGASVYNFSVAENAANASVVGSALATDPDPGQTLTYSISAGNTGGAFAIDSAGQITVASSAALNFEASQSFPLTVLATDNGTPALNASATVNITLTDVNEAPNIIGQSRSITENAAAATAVGLPISATDVDAGANGTLSFSILSGNTGGAFAISPSGQISVATPAAVSLANSPFTLTVQVTDGGNLSAAAAVTINVGDVDDPPLFTSSPVLNATQDVSYSYTISSSDSDVGDTRTLTAPVLPAWLQLTDNGNGSGTLTGTPGNADVGPQPVTLVLTDSTNLQTAQSFTLTVINANDPPAFTSTAPTAAEVGSLYRYEVTGSDIDVGDAVNFALVSGPSWLSLNPAGANSAVLAGTPAESDVGSANVTLSATDNEGAIVNQSFSVVVSSVALNLQLIESSNNQRGLSGTRAAAPIIVQLQDARGNPLPNEAIRWQVEGGSATLDADNSATDSSGQARIGFSFGSPGAVLISATHTASGNRVASQHLSQSAAIGPTGGGGQTARAGQLLPEPFAVTLQPGEAKSLAGAVVQWEVVTGGGSLEASSTLTDDSGTARNRLTLGPQAGTNTVKAIVPGGREVLFSAEASSASGTLTIVSGDGQTVPTSEDSAPLIVQLKDANGVPVAAAQIQWSGENATPNPARSTTDSEGKAQTVVRIGVPGAASVTAFTQAIDAPAVTFQLNGGIANIPTLTPDEEDTGEVIDAACAALAAINPRSPAEEDLYRRCLELADNAGDNPDDVQEALQQLVSEIAETILNSAQGGIDAQNNNLVQRFNNLRNEQNGGSRNQFNIGLWTPDGLMSGALLAAATDDEESEQEIGTDFSRWGFFATGTIGRGEYEASTRRSKFDFDINGITAGVDYRFRDDLIGGLAVGYLNNDAEVANNGGTLDTTGYSVTGYAAWFSQRQWYVDGSLSWGRNNYQIDRPLSYTIRALDGSQTVVDQQARADFDGSQTGMTLSVGRDLQKGPWSLSSYLRGAWSRIEYDPYVEQMLQDRPGVGLALAVDGRSTRSLTSTLGGKATYVMSRDWGILMPTATLEWEHEYRDDPSRVSARFAFDPAGGLLEQEGEALDSNYFNAGIGVSALFPGGKSAYIYYEQLLGASRLKQGILSLGLRIEF